MVSPTLGAALLTVLDTDTSARLFASMVTEEVLLPETGSVSVCDNTAAVLTTAEVEVVLTVSCKITDWPTGRLPMFQSPVPLV